MLCVNIEHGHKAIGAIEVLAAIACLVNMVFAPRLALCMLLFYHLPFFVPYAKALMLIGRDDSEGKMERYKWNTITIGVYSARLVAFTIAGLVFLIYATNNSETVEYFCDAYTHIRFERFAELESKSDALTEKQQALKAEIKANIGSCVEQFTLVGWLLYVPAVLFQVHCLLTLKHHRKLVENTQLVELVYEEDI